MLAMPQLSDAKASLYTIGHRDESVAERFTFQSSSTHENQLVSIDVGIQFFGADS